MPATAYAIELLCAVVAALVTGATASFIGLLRRLLMTDHEKLLEAATSSLRSVVSIRIRDFLTAVQVGAETAIGMLDAVESNLLEAVRTINEDFGR